MSIRPDLGEVQETLLIPLYGRALDADRSRSVLGDRRAREMVEAIDYDFSRFRGPSLGGSTLRAAIFDHFVRDFLTEHPDGTVVDLGCGLSTRFDRLDNGQVRWFDLDLDDTIALRRRFFSDTDRYTMISDSIFSPDWHATVTEPGRPVFLLSEAVLLYFPAAEVLPLLTRLAGVFAGSGLALDTGAAFMMNTQDRNPVFRAVPARMKWGCDDPADLMITGWRLKQSHTFGTAPKGISRNWPPLLRFGLTAARWAPPVRSYRINLFTAEPAPA